MNIQKQFYSVSYYYREASWISWEETWSVPLEERSKEGSLLSLERSRSQSQSSNTWKGSSREDGGTLLSWVHNDRRGSKGHKLLQGKLHPDIRKTFFTMRTIQPWNRLLREVVQSPSLELFKTWLGRALSNLISRIHYSNGFQSHLSAWTLLWL